MQEVVHYILSWLLYGQDSAIAHIRYTSHLDADSPCLITILGDGLERPLHYPNLSQPEVEQLPNGHYVIHTDLIYNTFFFISRAEEVLNTQRDEHHRFLARYSRYSHTDWQTPLLDEYSDLLLRLLHLPQPQPGFSAVYLTHDIDTLTQYRHLRGAIGGILRGHVQEVLAAWKDIHKDPVYTFPWLIEQEKGFDTIYFIKHTSGRGVDYPQYCLHGRDFRTTVHLLQQTGATLGIHSSAYASYPLPKGTIHRSHYLSCSISRMQQLVDSGYTDDYTMGFADLAGFRLQTTRPVRWINPYTLHLSPLTLHPLTIMDCTLSNANYMNLNEDDAFVCAKELIETVRHHHGEVNLLWHNSIFGTAYHTSLYPKILSLL